MSDATIEVRVPTDLLAFGLDQDQIQHRVTEWLVMSLFTDSRISSGKAAKLLNISYDSLRYQVKKFDLK